MARGDAEGTKSAHLWHPTSGRPQVKQALRSWTWVSLCTYLLCEVVVGYVTINIVYHLHNSARPARNVWAGRYARTGIYLQKCVHSSIVDVITATTFLNELSRGSLICPGAALPRSHYGLRSVTREYVEEYVLVVIIIYELDE